MAKHSKNIYKNMKIAPLTEYENSSVLLAISNLDYGLFVWDYGSNICFINKYMIEKFHIEIENVELLQDYLATRVDDNTLFNFLAKIHEIRSTSEITQLEFPIVSRNSSNMFNLEIRYDTNADISVGLLKAVDMKKKLESDEDCIDSLYEHMLKEIELRVAITNEKNELIFANFEPAYNLNKFYEDIERLIKTENVVDSDTIEDIQITEKSSSQVKLQVIHNVRNTLREEQITRKQIVHKDKKLKLYTHHIAINSTTEQVRLRKIIRANELMMETKDIVDHIDDLNDMFDYLLSKIQTVIPEVSRGCILSLNEDEELFLETSYGFNDDYVEEFGLPFKKSFAYIHLHNDFTKSVIINDIQHKYGDLFPDIKGDNTRFTIQSNITTPIVINGVLYGLISVDSDRNRVFDDVDTNLLDYIKVQTERAIDKYQKISMIKKDSMQDTLTGISNRRHLLEALELFKDKAIKESKTFKFVVFDIDGLKSINDTYGHNFGDKFIKEFAFIVSSNIRDTDFISRIGGDEFVGLFYDIDDEVLINRIKTWQRFFKNNPILHKDTKIEIRFSYGISEYPRHGKFFSELMEVADLELYDQKNEKRKIND